MIALIQYLVKAHVMTCLIVFKFDQYFFVFVTFTQYAQHIEIQKTYIKLWLKQKVYIAVNNVA